MDEHKRRAYHCAGPGRTLLQAPQSQGWCALMQEFLLIGAGAVFGANLRYWITNYLAARWGQIFPYGTLVINITGSFLLGFVLTLIANRLVSDPGYRLLI